MKKILVFTLILFVPIVSIIGQETLSRKQKKEIKKQQKIEKLQNAIESRNVGVITSKLVQSNGKIINARGGVLYLNPDEAEFQDFFFDEETGNTVEFKYSSYSVNGNLKNGYATVNFLGFVNGEPFNFSLTIESSGKTTMTINRNNGGKLVYYGKTKAL